MCKKKNGINKKNIQNNLKIEKTNYKDKRINFLFLQLILPLRFLP